MNFTTVDNVRMFLNKAALTPEETALVTMLISTIDGVIRNYCGWEVLAKDYTNKKYDGNSSNSLDLKVYPVNSVASVTIDGNDNTADVLINEEDGELYFDTLSGLTFTAGKRNVTVTFNAGFAEAPDDLVHAASWLVALNFNRITSDNIGVATERFNDVQVEYDTTDIPVLVKRVLDRYRHLSIF